MKSTSLIRHYVLVTVRDKVKGGVTLQGQGGEKEIATSSIGFLKKLGEGKKVEKNLITEEQVRIARQTIGKRGSGTGMTKEEVEVIKEQYLDMDNSYDKFFYDYLLEKMYEEQH